LKGLEISNAGMLAVTENLAFANGAIPFDSAQEIL
jgi:hypothetical protein